jgi:hypothetical protein
MRYSATSMVHDKKLFELADRFLKAEPGTEDLLFYIWGHIYELDYDSEVGTLRSFQT